MLTRSQILTLLQLPQMGRKTVLALAEQARIAKVRPEGNGALAAFLQLCAEKKVARGLKNYLGAEVDTAAAFARKIEEDAGNSGVKVTTVADADFPQTLLQLKRDGKCDSPVVIYTKGDFSLLSGLSVAIVGTRTPSMAGSITTTCFAEAFARQGFNVVSGLALGCDTAAHRAALNVGGKTTAILAHGLDSVYPPENRLLMQEIVEKGGLLLSEYPLGTRPQLTYFIERDRLQAAAAQATIVVEADASSGARHAVSTAINNQKPAFCTQLSTGVVPALPGALFCEGPQMLSEDNLMDTIRALKNLR